MNSILAKKLYYQSCCEELKIFKPGNENIYTKFSRSKIEKFKNAAKISSEILIDKKFSFGECVFNATKKCYDILGSNYNLGIILMCAPILRVIVKNCELILKERLNIILQNIDKNDGDLILKAIKYAKPGGLKNYEGNANLLNFNDGLTFKEIMKIGSKKDRISKCYINIFSEIFDYGLPLYRKLKHYTSHFFAGEKIFLYYLSKDTDSHLQRKFGIQNAKMVQNKAILLNKKIKFKRNQNFKDLLNFDRYLKKKNYNPGTCADLTVTTLLIDKIIDIVSIPH